MQYDGYLRRTMNPPSKQRGAAVRDQSDDTAPARRVGHQVKLHRRELMAAEFERIALDLFVERGYASVSVEDIADAAGVSSRTFYRYFAAKEDVLALYPQRLSDFVREALSHEPPDRPIFDAFSSVLVKLVVSMDLDELRHWWGALISDPHSYRSMALNQLDLRHDMEPLFTERFAKNPRDSMHVDLALSAGQGAMIAAARAWYVDGGDLVDLVQEALDLLARGFAELSPPHLSCLDITCRSM